MINETYSSQPSPLHNLTPTELTITTLVTKGLSDKEIALVHGVSPHTIKQHKKNIFSNKSIELVALAYDSGLMS